MRFPIRRPATTRRGLTLVEMLVAVALLILMMTIVTQIFQAATTTLSASRVYQDLDSQLRQIDSTIRQDLLGATAKFTPPLNPKLNLGYFEYIENEFADAQGEDTDDCLRFTAKAPDGQYFTGHFWVPLAWTNPNFTGTATGTPGPLPQPITIQSQYAEIIYFLRNGNLYRRVLLVSPQLTGSTITSSIINSTTPVNFFPSVFAGTAVGWQGMHDISAHPIATGGTNAGAIVLNTLADLTNRENRWPAPRFANDFVTNSTGAATPDGKPDDQNSDGTNIIGDGVNDYYPSLYPGVFSPSATRTLINETNYGAMGLTPLPRVTAKAKWSYDIMPFPYIYPGAYSKPDPNSVANGLGWIHSLDPTAMAASSTFLGVQNAINHSPLDVGDNLATPSSTQTWWGFPTWRETLSTSWADPGFAVHLNLTQPPGLSPLDPTVAVPLNASPVGSSNFSWLPDMTTFSRFSPQPFNDGYGTSPNSPFLTGPWVQAWEDDLIMTNVRSFDIKAYDNAYAGYADLGWGDDLRIWANHGVTPPTTPPFLSGNSFAVVNAVKNISAVSNPNGSNFTQLTWPPSGVPTWDVISQTFAHEGRIPPLTTDLRLDPQYIAASPDLLNEGGTYPSSNVGDDNSSVIRLRRVWDSWSTEYTNAPSSAYDPASNARVGLPLGPPVYPSYPPPYAAPLRGIQIQIRVTDPRNERIKTVTIRQDFTDKLE